MIINANLISHKNTTANIAINGYMRVYIVILIFVSCILGPPLLFLFCIFYINPIIRCCMCSKRYIKNTFFGTGFGDTIVSTDADTVVSTDDDTIASVDSDTVV